MRLLGVVADSGMTEVVASISTDLSSSFLGELSACVGFLLVVVAVAVVDGC
jgi:hypothetical protein